MACPVLFRGDLILLKSPGRVWEACLLVVSRPVVLLLHYLRLNQLPHKKLKIWVELPNVHATRGNRRCRELNNDIGSP